MAILTLLTLLTILTILSNLTILTLLTLLTIVTLLTLLTILTSHDDNRGNPCVPRECGSHRTAYLRVQSIGNSVISGSLNFSCVNFNVNLCKFNQITI